jgi:hypothetical protein
LEYKRLHVNYMGKVGGKHAARIIKLHLMTFFVYLVYFTAY